MTLTQILQKIRAAFYTRAEIDSIGGGVSLDSTIKAKARSVNGINADANGDVNILDLVHPIGSLYWSKNPTDPSVLFGGTWKRIKDTFILACGDTYSIDSTGGEATHTLTIDEMPGHNHSAISSSDGDHNHSLVSITGYDDHNFINGPYVFLIQNSDTTVGWPQAVGAELLYGSTGNGGSHSHSITVNSTGDSQPHNNMPPYTTYYCWERIE